MSSNPYRTQKALQPYFQWKAYMDWNGDGFWCRDALPSDAANEVSNPLDFHAQTYESKGTGVITIVTGADGKTRFGNDYYSVTASAFDGINIFKDGAIYEKTTTNGQTYTIVFWVKWISGLGAGLVCRLRTASDTATALTLNLPFTGVGGSQWNRVQAQFTASASNNVFLQVYDNGTTGGVFQLTGIMFFTGTGRIPYGFNTGAVTTNGQLLDGYDNISGDLRKMNWFLGMRKPYQDVCDDQTASVTVHNGDQKYTPENTTSPVYSRFFNGKQISIEYELDGGANNSFHQMYVGNCDFASVAWRVGDLAGKLDVTIPFTWYTKIMKETQVDMGLYTDTLTGEIIRDGVLDTIYGLDTSLIEDGLTTIEDYGDAPTQNEWSVIVELTAAERGRFFVARDGRPVFWDRHHLLSEGSDTITATVNSALGKDYYPPRNLSYVYGGSFNNIIRVKVNPRQTGSSETLWQLDHAVTIPVSSSIPLWITLRRSTGQYAASGSLSLSGATYSSGTTTNAVTAYGGRAKLTLDNASSSVEAVLTALTVSGAPQVQQNAMEYIASAEDDNLATYGRHELTINLTALSSANDAFDLATFELLRRQTLTGDILWISYKHASDGFENVHQYTWEIGDRLTVIIPELSHERDYVIIGEEHSVDFTREKGHHETKFLLEPAYPFGFWLLGVAGSTELGQTTYLGY